MAQPTDKDVAHFLSENWELLRWVFKIVRVMTYKSTAHYRDEKSAYGSVITAIREAGLCGDYEKTRQSLKMLLMKWEMMTPMTDYRGKDEDEFRPVSMGCPFMR